MFCQQTDSCSSTAKINNEYDPNPCQNSSDSSRTSLLHSDFGVFLSNGGAVKLVLLLNEPRLSHRTHVRTHARTHARTLCQHGFITFWLKSCSNCRTSLSLVPCVSISSVQLALLVVLSCKYKMTSCLVSPEERTAGFQLPHIALNKRVESWGDHGLSPSTAIFDTLSCRLHDMAKKENCGYCDR